MDKLSFVIDPAPRCRPRGVALFCPSKPTELAIFRKTPNAKSKCDCMHALAGGILTVSSPNRRSTSISRAPSPTSSSDHPIDELVGLRARGFGNLADANNVHQHHPNHTNSKSSALLGMDLTTTGGPHRAAWATVVEGREHGLARGFAVGLLGPTAAAWARMGG